MRVNLFRSRNFEVKWPLRNPDPDSGVELIPDEEKIVIKMTRLEHGTKRQIENSMITVKGTQFQRNKTAPKSNKVTAEDVSLQYSIGTVKDMRLRESIVGWENVLDDKGNPIKYSWEKMTELLAVNADLDENQFGILEADLVAAIDAENSFTDSASLGKPKN
jgi:hypothetical protein